MCSDDPDGNLSYGILSKMLIDRLNPIEETQNRKVLKHKKYDIHYCSLQYQMGNPLNMVNYIKYPSHNVGERDPSFLPAMLGKVRPDIFWCNFDIQHYLNIKKYIPDHLMWIGWCPWDNHDLNQVPRAAEAFDKVDIRVAISKFGYEWLNQNGVRMDDYIYNIVDTDNFYPLEKDCPEIQEFRKRNPWYKEDTKILLFVGRPNWRKRMMHILSIAKELKQRGHTNLKIFLHSNFDDPAKTFDPRELIDALDIGDMIIQSQFFWDMGLPKGDLRIMYNIADLYIAPHGGEGFGMPIGEAMACGTPFIATDICTTREFAGENFERGIPAPFHYPMDGQNIRPDRGVARPYPNINEFCDSIESILYDDNRLKSMGMNGVKWVRENCSPDVVAKKWKDVFDTFDIPVGHYEGFE